MKHKIRLFIFFLVILLVGSHENEADAQEPYWFAGAGGGIDLPYKNIDSVYGFGYGQNFVVGRAFDENNAVQIAEDSFLHLADSNGTSTEVVDTRILFELRAGLDFGGFGPFLVLGPGVDVQNIFLYDIWNTSANFDSTAGIGIKIHLQDKSDLFIESKANVFFFKNSDSDPISYGESVPILIYGTFGL